MTSDTKPSPQEPLLRQRCADYLLGEMTPHQAARFESEFDSPAVAQALIRESELLCLLAHAQVAPAAHTTSDIAGPAPRSLPLPLPSPATAHRTATLQRITLVIAALAATILVISLASMHLRENQVNRSATALILEPATTNTSFEFELAKTWVQPAVDWDTAGWSAGVVESTDPIEEDNLPAEFGEAVNDETFSWMVVALEAAIGEEDRNDG
ncbi:hypothetical protein [Planctomycetes bacterium TBK1r]|uniref:Anti sigma-E protein RseA N-terminal domain-containing protein n=1 Tax=Stieleria magnilauensis TaxID=2527963 RepID=A0ABX5Y1H0_9BACT|nr:hypothetical protein TBK1r_71410 [Planctomycetes bacterium TBK1r]